MKPARYLLLSALCLSLSGCVVGAVADLAATTVVTAGKLAVKGTGALIDAAIPDGDKQDKKKEKEQRRQTSAAAAPSAAPTHNGYHPAASAPYGIYNRTDAVADMPRYITVSPDGSSYETAPGHASETP